MGILQSIVALVLLATSIAAMVYSGFLILKATHHMFKVVTNRTSRYSYNFGPFVFGMRSQFNAVGNEHRVQLLRLLPKLAFSFAAAFGLYFIAMWLTD